MAQPCIFGFTVLQNKLCLLCHLLRQIAYDVGETKQDDDFYLMALQIDNVEFVSLLGHVFKFE
jgi:hypothetical protein